MAGAPKHGNRGRTNLRWSDAMRSFLLVLNKFEFDRHTNALIFNAYFCEKLKAAGYSTGKLSDYAIRDHFQHRHLPSRGARSWAVTESPHQTIQEWQSRMMYGIDIHAMKEALDAGIEIGDVRAYAEVTVEDAEDEDADDADAEDEDEDEDEMVVFYPTSFVDANTASTWHQIGEDRWRPLLPSPSDVPSNPDQMNIRIPKDEHFFFNKAALPHLTDEGGHYTTTARHLPLLFQDWPPRAARKQTGSPRNDRLLQSPAEHNGTPETLTEILQRTDPRGSNPRLGRKRRKAEEQDFEAERGYLIQSASKRRRRRPSEAAEEEQEQEQSSNELPVAPRRDGMENAFQASEAKTLRRSSRRGGSTNNARTPAFSRSHLTQSSKSAGRGGRQSSSQGAQDRSLIDSSIKGTDLSAAIRHQVELEEDQVIVGALMGRTGSILANDARRAGFKDDEDFENEVEGGEYDVDENEMELSSEAEDEAGPFPGEVNDPNTVTVPPVGLNPNAPPRPYSAFASSDRPRYELDINASSPPPPSGMTNVELQLLDERTEQDRLGREYAMLIHAKQMHPALGTAEHNVALSIATQPGPEFRRWAAEMKDVSSDEEEPDLEL